MGGTRGQSWREIGTDAVREPRYPGRFALGEARGTVEQTRRPEWLSTRPRVATLEDRNLVSARLPVTLSLVPSHEELKMAEASGGRVSLPAPAQLDNQYIQGVSDDFLLTVFLPFLAHNSDMILW